MVTKKTILITLSIIAVLYLILLIPTESPKQPKVAEKKQFIWNKDSLWFSLEASYRLARNINATNLNAEISKCFQNLNKLLDSADYQRFPPTDGKYFQIENTMFYLASLAGACKERTKEFIDLFSKIRSAVKIQSRNWDLNDLKSRNTLYELIYGGRAAVEELLLQNEDSSISSTIYGDDELSFTLCTEIMGVQIHSGDILVSRGGAPTSALIARGSDYPGNFSHVAMVYIDEKTKAISIIESHIERGVVISTLDDYLKDKKLRIMVLRLRADHPRMIQDKMLPHKAAMLSYDRVKAGHIPYDFEMNYHDNSKLFCSEVVSSAYRQLGVNLWMSLSSISSIGTAKWLAGFGVKHFETQEPSDLEYDPQLTVVAEWVNAKSLFRDHIDNAIIEAILEKADAGKELGYDWYMLPIARVLKLYSSLLNLFNAEGPVPEGMSSESALRHKRFVGLHQSILIPVERKAKYFKESNGYTAPYWRLVEFARKAIDEKKLL